MSNAIIERKNQITGLLSNPEVTGRLVSLFSKDENKAEKFKATLMNIALDATLLQCTPASIIKSALQLAELELPLAKGLGQAYIVKYKADAEAVIGYKGWLALAERGGKSVKAKAVFKCDVFSLEDNGFDETVTFRPNYDERKDFEPDWVEQNLKGVLVSIKDNNTKTISNNFVSFGKIKQIAGKSPARNSKFSPYVDWGLEMYQAKALKYVLSKTPMTEQIARAVEIDNKLDIERIQELKKDTSINLEDLIDIEIENEETK